MRNEFIVMVKKVFWINFRIGLVLLFLSFLRFREYTLALGIGMVVSFINFFINGILTTWLIPKLGVRYYFIHVLGFFFRIPIISLIGYIVFTYNKYNVIAYMLGYTLHLIGVFVYSYRSNATYERGD